MNSEVQNFRNAPLIRTGMREPCWNVLTLGIVQEVISLCLKTGVFKADGIEKQ